MNTKVEKQNLRKEVRTRLKETQKEFKNKAQADIQKTLFSVPRFQNANIISVYMAKGDEVGTSGIFGSLWESGKKVVLSPRIKGQTLEMCQVRTIHDFVQSPYGLHEPDPHIRAYSGPIDVVVVPGIAFDIHGHRLGRGKGYYDRFLKTTRVYAIALAYDVQILRNLPNTSGDMKMDIIITEKRIIRGTDK